ncbi:MAG TPA: hypothetical protein VIF62_07690 [Labilithrix sp.]
MRPLYFASFSLLALACSSKPGASQSSDGTDPSTTGTSPEAFCEQECIPDDHDKCMQFATRFSDAFLAAFEQCGDNPACVEPRLDAAPRTDRETKFANDYCAVCGGGNACAASFFQHDQPGGSVAQLSDARLDEVEQKCFPSLSPADGGIGAALCQADFATCVIPFLEEDVKTTVVCRQQVR